jgi:hypothetical protein
METKCFASGDEHANELLNFHILIQFAQDHKNGNKIARKMCHFQSSILVHD